MPLQKLCSALLTLDFSLPLGDEELEGLIQARREGEGHTDRFFGGDRERADSAWLWVKT